MPQIGNTMGNMNGEEGGEMAGRRFVGGVARLQERQFPAARHGLSPVVHVELAKDVLQVLLDRARGDHQPVGDRLVREPFAQQAEHFQLALGEPFQGLSRCLGRRLP